MSTFSERLSAAFNASGKTRAELAAVLRSTTGKMGISAQAVGQQLDGTTKQMTAENAARAARALGIDIYWLCTGEGVMNPKRSGSVSAGTPDALIAQLARVLAAVPAEDRPAVADALAGLAKAGGTEQWQRMVAAAIGSAWKLAHAA